MYHKPIFKIVAKVKLKIGNNKVRLDILPCFTFIIVYLPDNSKEYG